MASGLYTLGTSISRSLSRCIKHSSSSLSNERLRCGIATLAFQSGFIEDCEAQIQRPSSLNKSTEILTLKEKEKGDWRNLTFEEKKELYCMSFSQPFHVVDQPADEWKIILAGAFTAMGIMTLGMYVWLSGLEKPEAVIGPLSLKVESKNKEGVNLFYGNELAKVA